MVQIDTTRCIGCGQCVKDCFARQLRIEEQKAIFLEKGCIGCGHCLAICPTQAVSIKGVPQTQILPLPEGIPHLDPEQYLLFLKGRRTIRQFTRQPVSEALLQSLLEVVRFSPTGANKQDVFVSVIQKEIPAFRDLVLETLLQRAEVVAQSPDALPKDKVYAAVWKKLHRDFYSEKQLDRLFFGAPTVIMLSSIYPPNAAIAAAHMESMVYALGLGMFYSGFTAIAATNSAKVREFLQLPPQHVPMACLVIGHPDVTYHRTVWRNPVNVVRK